MGESRFHSIRRLVKGRFCAIPKSEAVHSSYLPQASISFAGRHQDGGEQAGCALSILDQGVARGEEQGILRYVGAFQIEEITVSVPEAMAAMAADPGIQTEMDL